MKILGVLLLLVIIAFGLPYTIYNKSLPKDTNISKVDALAQKLLVVIGDEKYVDKRFLAWSYVGKDIYTYWIRFKEM